MNKINRRTVLKGLGGMTIGLPVLEEMTIPGAVAAKANAVPTRLIHVEVHAHALSTQSAGKEQAVFHGHRAVFPSVPDETGW